MRNFKRILKPVGIFLLIVSLISAALISCYLRGENYFYQDGRERDRASGTVNFLICGASYAFFGVRSDTVSQQLGVNCYNLSGTLLTLQGRYTLLKQELERNPTMEAVLLEVSPDTLLRNRSEEGPKGDIYTLGRLNRAGDRWRFFWEAFTPDEWPAIYYDMVSKGMECVLRLLNGSYTTENQILKAGFYENHNPQQVELPAGDEALRDSQSLPEMVNPEDVEWLEKIVELCKAHSKQVYLFTTPQSDYYNKLYSNLDYYHHWFANFAERCGLRYYNFNLDREKLRLLPDEDCFYDDTHLNAQGGEIFTGMIVEVLRNDSQGIDNSERFLASYAELRENAK